MALMIGSSCNLLAQGIGNLSDAVAGLDWVARTATPPAVDIFTTCLSCETFGPSQHLFNAQYKAGHTLHVKAARMM